MKTFSVSARLAGMFLFLVACGEAHHDKLILESSGEVDAGPSQDTATAPPTCDTDNKCVVGTLVDGGCKFKTVICDDKSDCTHDTCDKVTGKCEFDTVANDGADCDDDNPCTVADYCLSGGCKAGANKNCDDGNGCTVDACNAKSGNCANTPVEGCKPAPDPCLSKSCNDNNPCTDDSCEKGQCYNDFDAGNVCTDNNVCTTGDHCGTSGCVGNTVSCDDGNPCTNDKCIGGMGCTHEPSSQWACSDNNPNTVNDQCVGGVCKGQVQQGCNTNCDDANVCTTDWCEGTVCKHSSIGEGLFCSSANNAVCKAGVCTAVFQPQCPGACNDNNPCTSDTCVSGACKYTPIAGCGTSAPTIALTITWTKDTAAQATINEKGVDTVELMVECKQAGNDFLTETVQIEWNVYASAAASSQSVSHTFQTKAVTNCKVNVLGKKQGSKAIWFARGGPKAIEGIVSYVWDGIAVSSVAHNSNSQGGYDWKFAPGADSDGDGNPDTTDPAKYNAAVK